MEVQLVYLEYCINISITDLNHSSETVSRVVHATYNP